MKSRAAFAFAGLLLFGLAADPAPAARPSEPEFPEVFSDVKDRLWVLKGRRFAEQGRFERAKELFDRAIRARPQSIAWYYRGWAAELLSRKTVADWHTAWRTNLARSEFKEQAAAPPLLKEKTLARAAREAVESYEKAAASFPYLESVFLALGRAKLNLTDDPNGAIWAFAKAAELKPDDPDIRARLGEARLAARDFDGTAVEAGALPEKGPHRKARSYLLGRIEFDRKNYLKSEEFFRRARGHPLSDYYRARALDELQQARAAAKAYRRFVLEFVPATPGDAEKLREARESLARLSGGESPP